MLLSISRQCINFQNFHNHIRSNLFPYYSLWNTGITNYQYTVNPTKPIETYRIYIPYIQDLKNPKSMGDGYLNGWNRLQEEINNSGSWDLARDAMQTIIECLEHHLIPRNPQFRSREPPREILSCVVIHMNEIVVRFRRGRLENINRTSNPLFLT